MKRKRVIGLEEDLNSKKKVFEVEIIENCDEMDAVIEFN